MGDLRENDTGPDYSRGWLGVAVYVNLVQTAGTGNSREPIDFPPQ
jgi:hypothetical protein